MTTPGAGDVTSGEAGTTYDACVVDTGGRPLLVWASWSRTAPSSAVDELLGVVDSLELRE